MRRLFFLLVFAVPLLSSDPEHIIRKFNEKNADIQDMTLNIHMKSRLPGLTIPDRDGTLYFKRPDKMHLEGEGFMMLSREAFFLDFDALLDSGVTVTEVPVPDNVSDAHMALNFTRIIEHTLNTTVAIVDTVNWVLIQLRITEGRDFSSRVDFNYTDVGNHQLPSRILVTLEKARFQNRHVRNPRTRGRGIANEGDEGYMEINLSGYRLNTGLDDSIFNKEATDE